MNTFFWCGEAMEDHEIGYASHRYQAWKALLHHFYEPFPQVSHYEYELIVEPWDFVKTETRLFGRSRVCMN